MMIETQTNHDCSPGRAKQPQNSNKSPCAKRQNFEDSTKKVHGLKSANRANEDSKDSTSTALFKMRSDEFTTSFPILLRFH